MSSLGHAFSTMDPTSPRVEAKRLPYPTSRALRYRPMSRPAPTAEGTFAKTPFAHVLLYTREHGLTGTLAVQGEGPALDLRGETLVAVEEGKLTAVRLPSRSDPIGSVLVEMG